MTLSRSPSPIPGGGWSSPGLNINDSGRSSPSRGLSPGPSGSSTPWTSSKMRPFAANGYPSFSTQNQGFFQRHMRRISSNLPRFHNSHTRSATFSEKDKQTPGWARAAVGKLPLVGRLQRMLSRWSRRTKSRLLILLLILFSVFLFYQTPLIYYWRRTSWLGGGAKFVIILAANVEGGVMQWKGAREWAIERDSIKNKKNYADRWGYELEIVDMSTKKRYAHEWRESWEKVDYVRKAFHKYPDAEWVWWLDLNTVVMEPFYSLQDHIFKDIVENTYRDINEFNPLNISHPFTSEWLDDVAKSPVGDGKAESINMLLSQDCSGFNLGSFFMKRSLWTDQLLDLWWDPVHYEQKHMQWAHKEQDALAQLYTSHPWVRQHIAFLPQRKISSFPPAACTSTSTTTTATTTTSTTTVLHPQYHYHQEDRDFVVSMAGCEWGRDCWGEMYRYRQLSYYLNRNWWERFKEDLVAVAWFKVTGQKVKL